MTSFCVQGGRGGVKEDPNLACILIKSSLIWVFEEGKCADLDLREWRHLDVQKWFYLDTLLTRKLNELDPFFTGS